MSQHESFSGLVFEIFRRADQHQLFHQLRPFPSKKDFGDAELLNRAIVRNSNFRRPDSNSARCTTRLDHHYLAKESSQEQGVYELSSLVTEWSHDLNIATTLLDDIENWGIALEGDARYPVDLLGFDMLWLNANMPIIWCSLIDICTRADKSTHKYQLMMTLSTMLYTNPKGSRLMQTLLAFATVPALRALKVPTHETFKLSDGYKPTKNDLLSTFRNHEKYFSQCPEARLPPHQNEHPTSTDARRRRAHQSARDTAANTLAEQFLSQWPASTVYMPAGGQLRTYFSIVPILASVSSKFGSFHRNKEFKEFIGQAQSILNSLRPSSLTFQTRSISVPTFESRLSSHFEVDWSLLLSRAPPAITSSDSPNFDVYLQTVDQKKDCKEVKKLVHRMLSHCHDKYEEAYSQDMLRSLECLQNTTPHSTLVPNAEASLRLLLKDRLSESEIYATLLFNTICTSFAENR